MWVVGAERPLEGLHIVVDAGNGAGGFFAVGQGAEGESSHSDILTF